MHKGFYDDYFSMKREIENGYLDLDELTFAFMENICDAFYQDDLSVIHLEKYLHGYCDEFALLLNAVFHYPIEIIFFSHRIIHAYCKVGKYFIDVRGVTDDEELFFSEFTEELKKETHRVTYTDTKKCFEELCDWCGLNYHIVNKQELSLLASDKYLKNYYELEETS